VTRDDCLAIVLTPGAFFGLPPYAPYFWLAARDGCVDELLPDGCCRFRVSEIDTRPFSEHMVGEVFDLWATEDRIRVSVVG
jgi:hypothetical protein